jgi:single-stranded-DNA-specific exonuclease
LLDAELSVDTARILRGGGPWGQGFPEPVFDGEFNVVDFADCRHPALEIAAPAGAGGRDVSARDAGGRAAGSRAIDAIAFGFIGGAAEGVAMGPGKQLRVAYRLEVNEYRGVESVQLNCQHLVEVGR